MPCDDRTNSAFDGDIKGAMIRAGAVLTGIPDRWAAAVKDLECIQTEEAGGNSAWIDNEVKGRMKVWGKNCD